MKVGKVLRNIEEEIKQNLEEYEEDTGLTEEKILYFLQKDAIQNSIDAMKDESKFSVTFELLENRKGGEITRYLIITDTGTTGLVGKGIPLEKEDEKSAYEYLKQYPSDKWARFENLYFSKRGTSYMDLGSKGRGKLIFLAASVDYKIYFDSLREDGTYKFGGIFPEGDLKRIVAEEGEESKSLLMQELSFLRPLTEVGTRIIIVSPKPEILKDFKNLEKYIQETWWLALQKGLKFYYKSPDQPQKEVQPSPLLNFSERPIKRLDWKNGELKKGKDYKYKELVIALADSPLNEFFAGVYIQRGYMKICNFNDFDFLGLSDEVKNKIYGYIIFDKTTEKEFRENVESPTHFSYNKKVELGRALTDFLKEKTKEFADRTGLQNFEKLSQKESWAKAIVKEEFSRLNKQLAKLGLVGKGLGLGTSSKERITQPQLPSDISFNLIGLNENKTYKLGDTLVINAQIINKKLDPTGPYHVELNLYKESVSEENLVKNLFVKTYEKLVIGETVISNITSYRFPKRGGKGEYIIVKTILDKHGYEVYKRNERLWVDIEPPYKRGIFEPELTELKNNMLYEPIYDPEENKYQLLINENHPLLRKIMEPKNEKLLKLLVHMIFAEAISYVFVREPERLQNQNIIKVSMFPSEVDADKILQIQREIAAQTLAIMDSNI